MACPLCGDPAAHTSWLGSVRYEGEEFTYVECAGCRSLYCEPMPGDATVRIMYGPDYAVAAATSDDTSAAGGDLVLAELRQLTPGLFVDIGCGAGTLLGRVGQLGWKGMGVEPDERVAQAAAASSGARVVTDPLEIPAGSADVLHLGDVIEHLTRLPEQMAKIVAAAKPGGLLIAQGPLEANTNVFAFAVRVARQALPRRRTEMAPYHVILATASGQRAFFRRFQLAEERYTVTEVFWPAPARVSWRDLGRPRGVVLHCLRRLSRRVSRCRGGPWGNRYFYVGRVPA